MRHLVSSWSQGEQQILHMAAVSHAAHLESNLLHVLDFARISRRGWINANICQYLQHNLAKVGVESSNLFARSSRDS